MTRFNGYACRISLKKKNGKMPGGSTKLSVSVFLKTCFRLCVRPPVSTAALYFASVPLQKTGRSWT